MKLVQRSLLCLVLAVPLALPALAGGNNNGDKNCRGNCKGGPQAQQQSQRQSTEVRVRQEQSSQSASRSDSRSSSQSTSQSTSQATGGSATGGSATGGTANITINPVQLPEGLIKDTRTTTTETVNTVSVAEGAVQTEGGEIGDVSIDSGYEYEVAAAQASSVFTQACQTGSSGQVEGGGFNVVNIDAFCQRVDAARMWLEVHAYADRHGNKELAEKAGEQYLLNIQEAQELVEYDEYPAKVDNFFSRMIRPVAVIAALVLLI